MSKTDKTAPFWVQIADGYHKSRPWHAIEGDHECDLPEKPGRDDTRCKWLFAYTGKNVCPCAMCAGGTVKRGKRERRSAKRAIDEQSRELYNRLTDCPVCGVHMHAVGVNHDDC